MSIKLNKDQVGRIIIGTGKAILCGLSCLALIVPHVDNSISAMKRLTVEASYSGAIKAIMDSNMLDSYKKIAVDVLLKNQDEDYYKAVIEVVNSNMLDRYKVETIEKITTK
jgi:hypothetical protein